MNYDEKLKLSILAKLVDTANRSGAFTPEVCKEIEKVTGTAVTDLVIVAEEVLYTRKPRELN